MSKTGKCIETESKLVFGRGWGERGMGVTVTGYKFSLGDDEKFLKLNSCTTLNILKPQEYIFVG